MKTRFASFLFPVALFVLAISFSNCSKQRIAQNSYSTPEQFMYDNRPEEQEFELDGEGEGPIVGNQGTRLWLDSSIFMFANGNDVSYPFTLKLIEVYTPKDMELYDLPTVAQGRLLVTGGEIRVRAFKDGEELVLKPGKRYYAQMPSANPDPQMSMFFGQEVGGILDWRDDASAVNNTPGIDSLELIFPNLDSSGITEPGIGYDLFVPTMGWINCDYFYGSNPDSLTTVSYESDDDDLTNVMIFLYFDEIESVMRVYNSESGQVPIGASVKSLCFAMNSSGTMFYHYQTFNITSGHTVQVTMEEISEVDLLALMAGL
ncbi:MAG: hypothetical protein K9G46_14435 [Flavobacteriales bacterium]|jgi:hypothetical protein|nr:hypothetical protein [Flavobacteriales bacterium]